MEIKISTETFIRVLWIVCSTLSAIGILLMLYGIVATLLVDDNARIQEAIYPVAIISAAVAMSIVPWCLASSVSKLLNKVDTENVTESTDVPSI